MKNKSSILFKRKMHFPPGAKNYALISLAVLAFCLSISLVAWAIDRNRAESQRRNLISAQAATLERDIISRLEIYHQFVLGASILPSATADFNEQKWKDYVSQFQLTKSYPGLSSVGFVSYVSAQNKKVYEQNLASRNLENKSIIPEGERPEYAPISFYESYTNSFNSKFIGYDLYTDTVRKLALDRTRDTGDVALTDNLQLLGDSHQPGPSASFVMYMASYIQPSIQLATPEQRRSSLVGFNYVSFRSNVFFNNAIDASKYSAFSDVQIYDGTNLEDQHILYQSEGFENGKSKDDVTHLDIIKVFNRDWTIRLAGPTQYSADDAHRSLIIFVGGLIISFGIAGFLFLALHVRARALVYAQKDQAEQAKDELLSLASHQLRTPATAVKQYLGLVLEGYTGKVSSRHMPALQKAYSSNERQLETINQILYVAKADAGSLSIYPTKFDLNLLINDITLDMEDFLHDKGHDINFSRSRKKLMVEADESSIRMVIENLISNAGKYSYENCDIDIKSGFKNQEVFVSVTDYGVGISPENYNRLFQKFSRIDNDLSLQAGGSGIGLYIDKVLVELHGGRIEVDSKQGKGSTFTIFLPKKNVKNLTDNAESNVS